LKFGGIDIGSRYIKYVVTVDNRPVSFYKEETGHAPLDVCKKLVEKDKPDKLLATGYGRYLLEIYGSVKAITEIKAVARGAKEVFPSCRTIIDIGGQDTKAISLDESGMVTNFEMNDRCAAGTGKFIEVMAKTLGFDIDKFGYCHNGNQAKIKINSMCTVFAESEVVSLIAKGIQREFISSAIHNSIASRVIALVNKVGIDEDIVFAGGCAKNPYLKALLEEGTQNKIHVYDRPEMLAALGAALYASEEV
jgi:(R)-2-hydroxyacyl-CoA dehydratese activating ATPase